MKIYTQDRKRIIEMPREIWVAEMSINGEIYSTAYINAHLGTYNNIDRAKEVVKEIFDYHRSGKNSYIMPEQ